MALNAGFDLDAGDICYVPINFCKRFDIFRHPNILEHPLLSGIFLPTAPPLVSSTLKFYEENKEQLKSAEQVRVGHIVKHISWQTEENAACDVIKKAQDELKEGAVFETLAQKYSDCPENGGDLGHISRGVEQI